MTWEARLVTHIGVKNTFLQHGQYFTKLNDANESLMIDGLEVAIEYPKAKYYQHQQFASKLCDKNGQLLTKPISIKRWLYPGAAVKHYAFEKQTQFSETTARAFALLFAPVSCLYSIVTKSYLYETKARYSLVIPDIYDLKLYAQLRQKFNSQNFKQFYTSSYSDAALHFFVRQTTRELLHQSNLKRCQIIIFGQAPWSKMQKSRLNVTVIEASKKALRDYQLCDRYFNIRVVEWEDGNFIASSIVRELITENLARGFPWWHNFALAVRNRKLFRLVSYERKGLQAMVRNADWNEEAQKLFVKACHEALLKIYGKLYSRAKEGEYTQIERENERIRSGLIRCQNSEDLRHFLTADFWTKGGNISILADYWEELMPLTTKPNNWKLARSLALLALASYKPKRRQQGELAMTSQELSEEEE